MDGIVQWVIARAASVAAEPRDTDELRLQKTMLVTASAMFIVAGAIWGLAYFALGEYLAGSIPFGYAVFSTLSVLAFARLRHYHLFRFTQLLLILLLPFLLQLTLGGFINSSAVILWSIICPVGALVFGGPRSAVRWFLAYVALVVLSGWLEANLRASNHLRPELIILFFVMNIAAISAILFAILAFFISQKDYAFKLLALEQEKSENLLLNILPKEIAPILKNHPGTIAEHYDGASILCADIVNFTPWSVELPPKEMVEMLNEIFSYFDSLLDQYGVGKIRTIGDNYMAASGVPTPRPDHAQALARMALDMSAYIQSRPPRNGKRLDFRIGINSGPVIAGVIGKRKFVYDLWGDPVNTASRMESNGAPGKIQTTRDTYELIKEEFVCAPRGRIAIKGKGEMETWYLTGIKHT
ncbi:MAG: adenylate/guanylate cyclase domain-containing protein [Chloroflexi bacterium]|nr:adenylate/guanylate cyclase domain-containing protein [Chloroflexota bacterium]